MCVLAGVVVGGIVVGSVLSLVPVSGILLVCLAAHHVLLPFVFCP